MFSPSERLGNLLCLQTEFRIDLIEQRAFPGAALSGQDGYPVAEYFRNFRIQRILCGAQYLHGSAFIFRDPLRRFFRDAKIAFCNT